MKNKILMLVLFSFLFTLSSYGQLVYPSVKVSGLEISFENQIRVINKVFKTYDEPERKFRITRTESDASYIISYDVTVSKKAFSLPNEKKSQVKAGLEIAEEVADIAGLNNVSNTLNKTQYRLNQFYNLNQQDKYEVYVIKIKKASFNYCDECFFENATYEWLVKNDRIVLELNGAPTPFAELNNDLNNTVKEVNGEFIDTPLGLPERAIKGLPAKVVIQHIVLVLGAEKTLAKM